MGGNVCGQAQGGQRSPLAVWTTGDLLSSVQLETFAAGEVHTVARSDHLSRRVERVGDRRGGTGGLPLWGSKHTW